MSDSRRLDRRQWLGLTTGSGLAAALGATTALRSGPVAAAAADPPPASARTPASGPNDRWAAAAQRGIVHLRRRTDDQLPLVDRLRDAIAGGMIEQARAAYVESRPPYEEVEVLANCFVDDDRDIDARPYVFEAGELDEEFRGFHRIEGLIYGRADLEAALPYAEGLVESIKRLRRKLDEVDRFDAAKSFEGMIVLATEVSAKKISSEEETWSDQSLLIFKHNWLGIDSQYRPFVRALLDRDQALADAIDQALYDAQMTISPYFKPRVVAAAPYSTVPLDERRRIANASNRLRTLLVEARDALEIS